MFYSAGEKSMFENRRARFEYELLDRFEAGLVLKGTEIKSVRVNGLDFRDSFARFQNNELYLESLYIPPLEKASYNNHDPRRNRKLLLHRKELEELKVAVSRKGLSIVPVKMYFKEGRLKLEIALARGKKLHDKREAEKTKEAKREMERFR
jgi:SsrA-binding protein